MSNETAGEHYTPREVIRLVADLLIGGQTARDLTENQIPVRTIYEPKTSDLIRPAVAA